MTTCFYCDQPLTENEYVMVPYFGKMIQMTTREHDWKCEPSNRYMWDAMIYFVKLAWEKVHEI